MGRLLALSGVLWPLALCYLLYSLGPDFLSFAVDQEEKFLVTTVLAVFAFGGQIYLGVYLATMCFEWNEVGLRLGHRFRAWSGSWEEVRYAYVLERMFIVKTRHSSWLFPGWELTVSRTHKPTIDQFRRYLRDDQWLESKAAQRRFFRDMLPLAIFGFVVTALADYFLG